MRFRRFLRAKVAIPAKVLGQGGGTVKHGQRCFSALASLGPIAVAAHLVQGRLLDVRQNVVVPAARLTAGKTSVRVRDGLSNTIMIGEMERLNNIHNTNCSDFSHDGWAVGGISTLFSLQRGAMNCNFAEAPGSEHPGGAHFGFGDGSVRFLSENIDLYTLLYIGTHDAGEVPPQQY